VASEPFEEMYARAGDDLAALPWAELAPDRAMVAWLDSDAAPPPGRALVVGCGLGDDAEELARRGHRVTAFDLSPTAIARCRERFPGSAVGYRVADVLDPPAAWAGAWDVVVENRTIQSLEPADWPRAIAVIAALPAPGGVAYVRCFGRDDAAPRGVTRPWPLSRRDLAGFTDAGLVEEAFTDVADPTLRGRAFIVRYRRPASGAPDAGRAAGTAVRAPGSAGSPA
jgi:SAM-dependent methyltransferase